MSKDRNHLGGPTLPGSMSDARRWLIVGLLFVASLINYLDRATISIALPLIGRDLHLGPAGEGVLLSAFFWSYALMQIPIGWSADRFNLKWLYAATFAIWSFAQGLAGAAKSLLVLILTRILLGIGESIYLPGGTKIVTLLFPPSERGFPSGIFDFGTRCGMAIGLVVLPLLIIPFGWRIAFAIIGFVALLWLIPWFAIFPPNLRGDSQEASTAGTPGKAHPAVYQAAGSNGPARPSAFEAAKKLVTSRDLLGICIGFFCFDYYWYLFVTWIPDYLVTARHLTVLKAGLYAAAPFLVFGISEPVGGWIADRLIRRGFDETRTRKGLVTAGFLTGLLLIPAEHAASAQSAVLLLMGASLVGLSTGNLIVILQCCAPPEQVGLWTGVENFWGNIAGVLAPLLTGILISRTGSYAPGFHLAVFLLLAGLVSYWFIVGDLRPKL